MKLTSLVLLCSSVAAFAGGGGTIVTPVGIGGSSSGGSVSYATNAGSATTISAQYQLNQLLQRFWNQAIPQPTNFFQNYLTNYAAAQTNVFVLHTNGVVTAFPFTNSDASRGQAVMNAAGMYEQDYTPLAVVSNLDLIYCPAGKYDFSNVTNFMQIDALMDLTSYQAQGGSFIIGAGVNKTIFYITNTPSGYGAAANLFGLGTLSSMRDVTINSGGGFSPFVDSQYALQGTNVYNIFLNVNMTCPAIDAYIFTTHVQGFLLENCAWTVSWDLFANGTGAFPGTNVASMVSDSTLISSGPLSGTTAQSFARIALDCVATNVYVYNSILYASGGTNGTFALSSDSSTVKGGTVHVYNSTLTATGTVNVFAVYATGSQTNIIDSTCTINGAVTNNSAQQYNWANTGQSNSWIGSFAGNGNGLVNIPATSINHTIIQTNFISGGKYLNTFGVPIQVSANAVLTTAGVAGSACLSLKTDALNVNGGATNQVAISTLLASIAMNYTNYISITVPTNSTYYFTNNSTGAGDSATVVGGQIYY